MAIAAVATQLVCMVSKTNVQLGMLKAKVKNFPPKKFIFFQVRFILDGCTCIISSRTVTSSIPKQ
jgi:hypothetical protein